VILGGYDDGSSSVSSISDGSESLAARGVPWTDDGLLLLVLPPTPRPPGPGRPERPFDEEGPATPEPEAVLRTECVADFADLFDFTLAMDAREFARSRARACVSRACGWSRAFTWWVGRPASGFWSSRSAGFSCANRYRRAR
jgi:hypothetical protein